MKIDWNKLIVAIVSALIVALQGVNITQGVAISGTAHRVEMLEEDLSKANYELNKKIAANQDEFRSRWTAAEQKLNAIFEKLNQTPAPATH